MRLIRYINEQTPPVKKAATSLELGQVIDTIRKECKPFLKEVGPLVDHNSPIFRGIKNPPRIWTIMKGTRGSDRTPKFTAKEIFEIFDKAFADKFGWWVRSKGVFTGDKGTADGYGDPNLFIPMGNYKYVWASDYAKVWSNLTRPNKFAALTDEEKRTWLTHIEGKAKEAVKVYKNTGLKSAVKGHFFYEAVFQVKKYIVVSFPTWIKVKDRL